MADVRALLKAKRQEARITHPYATYNASGQLKCTVCASIVKHASAWEGHLGSKIHRTNLARMREEENRQREQEEAAALEATVAKRKAPAQEPEEPHADKKRKVEKPSQGVQSSSSFPQDFFSDPSRAPALLSDDSDNEEEDQRSPAQPPPSAKDTVVDLEYERFQRELLAINADPTEAYDRATVAAEPVPASVDIAGFPSTAPEVPVAPEPDQLTEAEARLKREQDERELIMDRLLEEERAQEEADTRVQLLKTKLEGLRRKRELAKVNKTKGPN